jgi:uncharacterized protein (TIGR02246 family)
MSQDAISQVRAAQREWIQAIREKNTSRLLDMVTKDILVIHPNGKIVRGVDELHADFKRFFEQFELEQLSEAEETVIAGEWAFDISKISSRLLLSGGGPSKRIDAKVFSLLRQQQGKWLIARVMSVILPQGDAE